MTNDRDLLFTDICARLKYNVKVRYKCFHVHSVQGLTSNGLIVLRDETDNPITTDVKNIQPYLFPLSSMTDEQEEKYNNLNCYELGCFPHTEEALDYLIRNHFDYRNLIPMGLAINATNKNIY